MNRVRLFGIEIDPVRMPAAVARVLEWVTVRDGTCRYVVTPNADHAVMLEEQAALRQAYGDAGLVLVDGMPILLAAKLLRRGIPERVTGSDLVPALFEAASRRFLAAKDVEKPANEKPITCSPALLLNSPIPPHPRPLSPKGERGDSTLRVYLLGAAEGVAVRAAARIEARWPGVRVVGCDSPAPGFEKKPEENDAILKRIAATDCDVLVVGLGAPKQELWVHTHRGRIAAPAVLCVGATIDFLAGEKARAPVWMQRVGLEWMHRLASEPRRLARRYLRDAVRFPRLFWRELHGGHPSQA